MDTKKFWRLIEEAQAKSGGECEAQADAVKSSLSLLPLEELIVFERIFTEYRNAAYRWDLWGAAVMLNGGSSNDGFEYFRWWLIGQGQAVFEGALADPDSLADLIKTDIEWGDAWLECEDIAYVALERVRHFGQAVSVFVVCPPASLTPVTFLMMNGRSSPRT